MAEYDPSKHPQWLIEHMTDGQSFTSYCAKYKIPRKTAYRWLDKYPEFKEAKEIGEHESQTWWEDLGRKLALEGNSAVYIFNMKNRFGWADRRSVDVAGKIEHHRVEAPQIEGFDDSEKPIELKIDHEGKYE